MPRAPEGLSGPSAPARNERDRTVPVAPDGTYEFRIKAVKDLGWVKDKFSKSGNDKPALRVTVESEQPDGGAKFTLSRDITHSYDARSILSKLGGIILDVDPNDKEAELDYRRLVDGRFLGMLQSREYHPRVDGDEQTDVTHFFSEWKGDPIPLPRASGPQPTAPPPSTSAPVQQPKPAATNGWTAAWEGQPQGSTIGEPLWTEVAAKLREMLDRFDSVSGMHAYIAQPFDSGFDQHGDVIQSFFRERGPNDVVFNAAGKTDNHAADLSVSLSAFLDYWKTDRAADGEDISDDLPF